MNKASIALIAASVVTSLAAQSSGERDSGRNVYVSPPAAARAMLSAQNLGARQTLDGGECYPPPYYENCIYDHNYYSLDSYRAWAFYALWNEPSHTDQSPQPPPPPPPPVTPVLREYDWPEQGNASATFSIVTTSGTVYLAAMVWVAEDTVHFNSVDGGVREIPLSSVSRSLTQTANAQKKLNLPLPWAQARPASVATGN